MIARRTAPAHREGGSGQLGTTFGVGVFLTLLLFASHLLLDLWLTSAVMGVGRDAALAVATAETTQRDATQNRAIELAHQALGRMANDVTFSFEPDPQRRSVILRVQAPEITLLPPGLTEVVGTDGLDRRIVIPIEEPEQ